jgi:hypothetical protein
MREIFDRRPMILCIKKRTYGKCMFGSVFRGTIIDSEDVELILTCLIDFK